MAKNVTPKSNAGRPTKMTEATVQKLYEAFAIGCSDNEACLYADIVKQTLYNYQADHPEFLARKELLKDRPILLARQSVIKGFKDSPELALKYLERKNKKEFSLKLEQELSGDVGITVQTINFADANDNVTV